MLRSPSPSRLRLDTSPHFVRARIGGQPILAPFRGRGGARSATERGVLLTHSGPPPWLRAFVVRKAKSLAFRGLQPTPLTATLPFGPGHCSVREDGRPKARSSKFVRATSRPPVRRFLFPPVPLLPAFPVALPLRLLRRLRRRSGRGLCAFIRHAGVIVPPGEPLGRTSPAARLRQPRNGGADPFPPNRRRDEASRRKGPRQDKGGGGGVDKIEGRKMRPYLSPCGRESDFNTLAESAAEAKC
jgi:hypothetical protein